MKQHGFVHGGVVSYLADNTLTFAGGAKLGVPVVTAKIKINDIRPATGDLLVAQADAISTGRSQIVVRCDVFTVTKDGERLCAAAERTVSLLRDKTPQAVWTGPRGETIISLTEAVPIGPSA